MASHPASDARSLPRQLGQIRLFAQTLLDRFHTSLFGVPSLWVGAAILVAFVVIGAERSLGPDRLPDLFEITPDNARAILTTVATSTITAASVVFSLTLLAIQLAATSYSSRVLRTFLSDRHQQHVIGIVLGTFMYGLVTLFATRGVGDEGGPVAPAPLGLSAMVAVVLGLVAVLALLASISHTARGLRVSAVSQRLVDDVLELIERRHGNRSSSFDGDRALDERPVGSGLTIEARRGGWVQQISDEALGRAVHAHVGAPATVTVDVTAGDYVYPMTPIMTVWLPTAEVDGASEELAEDLRGAISVGSERTLHQDLRFGLSMLEDIALRALSPSVNDPNTARAVLPRLGEVVLDVLRRRPPATMQTVGEVTVVRMAEPSLADYLAVAFDQLRVASRDWPTVQVALAATVAEVQQHLDRDHAELTEARLAIADLALSLDRPLVR